MAGFMKMVSMERTDEEKAAERARNMFPMDVASMPDVPPGLCICLTETELEKLDLDEDCDVGDTIHLNAFAKVTSVSKNDTANGSCVRIELSIYQMSVENEDEEGEEAEEGE